MNGAIKGEGTRSKTCRSVVNEELVAPHALQKQSVCLYWDNPLYSDALVPLKGGMKRAHCAGWPFAQQGQRDTGQ